MEIVKTLGKVVGFPLYVIWRLESIEKHIAKLEDRIEAVDIKLDTHIADSITNVHKPISELQTRMAHIEGDMSVVNVRLKEHGEQLDELRIGFAAHTANGKHLPPRDELGRFSK